MCDTSGRRPGLRVPQSACPREDYLATRTALRPLRPGKPRTFAGGTAARHSNTRIAPYEPCEGRRGVLKRPHHATDDASAIGFYRALQNA